MTDVDLHSLYFKLQRMNKIRTERKNTETGNNFASYFYSATIQVILKGSNFNLT